MIYIESESTDESGRITVPEHLRSCPAHSEKSVSINNNNHHNK